MKKILALIILITNLLSTSLIIENENIGDIQNCHFVHDKFNSKINIKNNNYKDKEKLKIVGIAYDECRDKKSQFKHIYKFYIMLEVSKSKNLKIINGKYQETSTQIIERYLIDKSYYLSIEREVKKIRKKRFDELMSR